MEDTISLTFKVHGIKQLVTRGGDQIDNMVFNGFYLLLTFIFLFLIISMQNGNQTEILKSGPKLLYFFPNRNQFIYSFPVFPACKRRINLGKMTLKEKKKRIKTKIKPLKNPRSECYQKVNVKNVSLTYSVYI